MASTSKHGKDNKASHTAVLKWEKKFNTKFDCDLNGKGIVRLCCTLRKNGRDICSIKNFTSNYICPGSTSIKKDSTKTHCLSKPHNSFLKMFFT